MNDITPGFVWRRDIGRADIDLRHAYAFPKRTDLETAWAEKQPGTVEIDGVVVNYCVFNPRAERRRIAFIPGYGVTLTNVGGARSAALMAALNPSARILWFEDDLQRVPAGPLTSAARGDYGAYAMYYLRAMERLRFVPDVQAGHSKGARIQTCLNSHRDAPRVSAISLSSVIGVRRFPFPVLNFGIARALLLENVLSYSRRLAAQAEDERDLKTALPSGTRVRFSARPDGQWRQFWRSVDLVRGLGRPGVELPLSATIERQQTAKVFIWQRTGDLVVSSDKMNDIVQRRYDAGVSRQRLQLLQSPMRHNSTVAHSALFARQVRWVVDTIAS